MYTNDYEKQAYDYILNVPTPINRDEMVYDVVMHLYDAHLDKVPLNESGLLCIIKHEPEFVFLLNNPSDNALVRALRSDPTLIKFMKPYVHTLSMQLACVKAQGELIRYCKSPPLEVQLAAVEQNHYALQYIINPAQEVIDLAHSIAPDKYKVGINTNNEN